MPDENVTQLSENTALALTDLLYSVKDPAGTPADVRIQIANLLKLAPSILEIQVFS